jgi:Neuraminidase (sialidase)
LRQVEACVIAAARCEACLKINAFDDLNLDCDQAADQIASTSGADFVAQVTTDAQGTWVAVWHSLNSLGGAIGTDRDILVARSTDGGVTWTAPAALNTNAATDSGQDRRAQVTTDGLGAWVAVWGSDDSLGDTIGTDYDILVARSTDNGATWTAAAALNTNAGTDSRHDFVVQVTTDGAGNWVAVWDSQDSLGDTIGLEHDILVSRSTNAGATWTAPVPLNTNAATDSGGDHTPQLTTDGAENWVAVWESYDSLEGTIGTDGDILLARSTNAGTTWTAPAALNTNAGSDAGRDLFAQVTTDGQGTWVAVWQSLDSLGGTIGTDWDILVARSTDGGATWTAPVALNTNAGSDASWVCPESG